MNLRDPKPVERMCQNQLAVYEYRVGKGWNIPILCKEGIVASRRYRGARVVSTREADGDRREVCSRGENMCSVVVEFLAA